MKTIESAIAIIRNGGRILLTWDDDWGSWLLPNKTVHDTDTPEHAQGSWPSTICHACHSATTACHQRS